MTCKASQAVPWHHMSHQLLQASLYALCMPVSPPLLCAVSFKPTGSIAVACALESVCWHVTATHAVYKAAQAA